MSAFMCEDSVFKAIALEALCGNGPVDRNALSAAATSLRDANLRSLVARYGTKSALEMAGGELSAVTFALADLAQSDAVRVLKHCDCFDYQACEVDTYDTSDAAKMVQAARLRAIKRLPGYTSAAWV